MFCIVCTIQIPKKSAKYRKQIMANFGETVGGVDIGSCIHLYGTIIFRQRAKLQHPFHQLKKHLSKQ
ncbi:hypothetical protein CICLE_v10010133mg [Citrus x clementina]|uniref:Uncharacterized protein n=1 Tax=Citrus clementina TaxID=85681 RepID=V4ULU7_CITCL|nr:hypothetical protein CICLE_v10010133mg [Citrus x clementina]